MEYKVHLLVLLTLVVLSSSAEVERRCPKGYWMRTTSEGNIRCDLCVDGENYISENDHQKRECNSCRKIQNSSLEILVKACYRDADAVIICISGYYRENGVCKHCSVCEHEIRPCQDYLDAVCCSDKDNEHKICNLTNKSANASTELEPQSHCLPSSNCTGVCKSAPFVQAICKNCCPTVNATEILCTGYSTISHEEKSSWYVSNVQSVIDVVLMFVLVVAVTVISKKNKLQVPWLIRNQQKVSLVVKWLTFLFPFSIILIIAPAMRMEANVTIVVAKYVLTVVGYCIVIVLTLLSKLQ